MLLLAFFLGVLQAMFMLVAMLGVQWFTRKYFAYERYALIGVLLSVVISGAVVSYIALRVGLADGVWYDQSHLLRTIP